MIIDRLIYFHTYPVGLTWQKIGMEASLTETDDPQSCLSFLKQEVEKFHAESVPERLTPTVVRTIQEPMNRESAMIADIYSCKDMKTLETYQFLISNTKDNKAMQAAYDEQFKKLQK